MVSRITATAAKTDDAGIFTPNPDATRPSVIFVRSARLKGRLVTAALGLTSRYHRSEQNDMYLPPPPPQEVGSPKPKTKTAPGLPAGQKAEAVLLSLI